MQIKKIQEIKSFGIFKDFKPTPELHDFTQYNLFYGWNGSGKSTLGKLLSCLSTKVPYPSFPNAKYKIDINNDSTITDLTLPESNINIHIFNSDFIQKNVDFEKQKASSILILSEERIEEMKKYKEKKEVQKEKAAQEKRCSIDLQERNERLEKTYSAIAKDVKTSFKLIDTDDRLLLNYDSRKLKQFISTNENELNKDSVLNDEEVNRLRAATKSTQKPDSQLTTSLFGIDDFIKTCEEATQVLAREVISKKIESLIADAETNKWAEQGLSIHKRLPSNECKFCGNIIPKTRLEDLNAHFSLEYQKLTTDLDKIKNLIDNTQTKLNISIPDGTSVYDEFQSDFAKTKSRIMDSSAKVNLTLDTLKKTIDDKKMNPFSAMTFVAKDVVSEYNNLLVQIQLMVDLIGKHNTKNKNFKLEIENNKKRLELHFVAQKTIDTDLLAKKKELAEKQKELDQISSAVKTLDKEIHELETILITEVKGAERFNDALRKFLARDDISLEFEASAKGYKLIRKNDNKPATNLSEGERTAVAFVYFIVKLNESSNQIANSVVVLDDPISSFDSNHLYHAYSYIKSEVETASQLIILTHNFQFFKLLRDWFIRKNEVKTQPSGQKEETIRARFFTIETTAEDERVSKISNAPDTLLKYGSEYHYLFQRLHGFKDEHSLDLEKAFMVANLSRKLLEGFLSFKFPKGRGNFYNLIQAGCADNARRERVYRFINKYSHGEEFDGASSSVDNLVGEGQNITSDIFQIIDDLDNHHFNEMTQLCTL